MSITSYDDDLSLTCLVVTSFLAGIVVLDGVTSVTLGVIDLGDGSGRG